MQPRKFFVTLRSSLGVREQLREPPDFVSYRAALRHDVVDQPGPDPL